MPELLKIESVKNHLEPFLVSKIIYDVSLISRKVFSGNITLSKQKTIMSLSYRSKIPSHTFSLTLHFSFHLKISRLLLFCANVQVEVLYGNVLATLQEDVSLKGVSTKDVVYALPNGISGLYQTSYKAYTREHVPCRCYQQAIGCIKPHERNRFYRTLCQT